MKRLTYIIIGIAALLCSCSNVDENERFIYVKPADVSRCVLLEDFTGQLCVNCPNAADEIHKIQELYGEDNVIAVAIHGGPLAMASNSMFEGFKTELCDNYYNAFQIESNPSGRVDRMGAASTPDQWQSLVSNRIQQIAPLSLAVENTYSEDGSLSIEVIAMGTSGNTTGKLQLWIIEDGIVGAQMMPNGSANTEYVHNHVLRDAVNGAWGDNFFINEGETKKLSFTATLDEKWKPENCHIVAFVYNDNGVQQVTKAAVVSSNDNAENIDNIH